MADLSPLLTSIRENALRALATKSIGVKHAENHLSYCHLLALQDQGLQDIDFTFLPILFIMDTNKDGFFSLKDIYSIALWQLKIKKHYPYDYKNRLEAATAIYFRHTLSTVPGNHIFSKWIIQLCSFDYPVYITSKQSEQKYFPEIVLRRIMGLIMNRGGCVEKDYDDFVAYVKGEAELKAEAVLSLDKAGKSETYFRTDVITSAIVTLLLTFMDAA